MNSDEFPSSGPGASSVCRVCQGLGDLSNPRGFTEKLEPAERRYFPEVHAYYEYIYIYVHHPNVGVLIASAEAGCDGCTILCDGLRRQSGNDFDAIRALYPPVQGSKQPESVAQLTTTMANDTQAATRFADVIRQDRVFSDTHLEHYDNGRVVLSSPCQHESGIRACSHDDPWPSLTVKALTTPKLDGLIFFFNSPYDTLDAEQQHRPCRDLLSDPHISVINRWRDTCKTEHMSCNRHGDKQPLPSRVLELSDPGNHESKYGVRLFETHEKMQGAYACLSYCWGDSDIQNQKGQTTKANFSKQLQAIALDSLPKTIIDAVYLCFKLGFRFLWVDRLCIIQDDEEDWEKEASRMCDIYSRSALTISVPLCTESSQSFLKKRLETHQIDADVEFATINYIDEISTRKDCLYLISKRLSRSRASGFLEDDWGDFTGLVRHKDNSWLTRGWTFQEWMLSPMVLHIDTMTLWDCFGGYANELNRRYTEKPRLLRDPEAFGGGVPWDSVVDEYTSRKITYKKDRLPALAGLAARYSQTTGHRYLAGLWFEEMPRSLLWSRQYHLYSTFQTISDDEESKNDVPSWSWASTDYRVYYTSEFLATSTAALSFLSAASVYRCSDPPHPVSAKDKPWIDIKGHIGVVTDEDMLGNYFGLSNSRLEGGNEWWNSIPDRAVSYSSDDIAQSRIHLMILGSSNHRGGRYGESSDGGSSTGDASSDDANIEGTHSERSSGGSEKLEDTDRIYGALVLKGCGLIDDRQCFRRLGIAYLHWKHRLNVQDGPLWKLQDIRLI